MNILGAINTSVVVLATVDTPKVKVYVGIASKPMWQHKHFPPKCRKSAENGGFTMIASQVLVGKWPAPLNYCCDTQDAPRHTRVWSNSVFWRKEGLYSAIVSCWFVVVCYHSLERRRSHCCTPSFSATGLTTRQSTRCYNHERALRTKRRIKKKNGWVDALHYSQTQPWREQQHCRIIYCSLGPSSWRREFDLHLLLSRILMVSQRGADCDSLLYHLLNATITDSRSIWSNH
jgi:hypothetical protein